MLARLDELTAAGEPIDSELLDHAAAMQQALGAGDRITIDNDDEASLSESFTEVYTESEYLNLREAARTGLTLKVVTDKNGNTVKRWVRTHTAKGSEPPETSGRYGPDHVVARALSGPATLTQHEAAAFAVHLRIVPKEECRQIALAMKQKIGGTKAAIADRLLAHIRSGKPAPTPETGTLSKPPTLPTGTRFQKNADPDEMQEAREAAVAVFGSDILSGLETTPRGLLFAASNAHDGARIFATAGDPTGAAHAHESVAFEVSGDGYEAWRIFYRDADKNLVCYNASFEVEKDGEGPDAKPTNPNLPRGADLLANQVRALKALGVDRIETNAAGNATSAAIGGYVGYQVWPKLGYDGPINPYYLRLMPPALQEQMGDSNRILKLYETKAGQEWWAENGSSINLTFDLKDGSDSLKTLEKYLANRTARA